MERELILLCALSMLINKQGTLSENTIRHLRILFSQFSETLIAEDMYQDLLTTLQDENYITLYGGKIQITPEGTALVHAIGENVMGQTAFVRLKGILDDYDQNPGKTIQNLTQQLSSLHEVREEKVQAVDGADIRVVGLLLEIRHKSSKLLLHRFKLDRSLLRIDSGIDKELNSATRKFIEDRKRPIITYIEGDDLCVVSQSRLTDFTLFNQSLTPFDVTEINRSTALGWNLVIAQLFMDERLAELGYLRSRWPGRTFIQHRDFDREQTNVGVLRASEAINVDYTALRDDLVFVWIETYTSPSKRVLDFITERVEVGSDDQAVFQQLSKLKLKIIPSGSEVDLIAVLPATDLAQERVPGTKQTYAEYWQNTRGIKASQNVQLMLVVKLFGRELHYPAEMVYIDKFSLERLLGTSQVRKPKPEDPYTRFRKVRDLSTAIKANQARSSIGGSNVQIRTAAPTLQQLCDLGGLKEAVHIKQPTLKFLGGAVSLDPLDVFEGAYGPACGRRDITITHLVLPQDRTAAEINAFLNSINKMFSRYRLGRLQPYQDFKVVKYDPRVGSQTLEEQIRGLIKVQLENGMALAVIPDGDATFYNSLKQLLPARTQTALQIVQVSTFEAIIANRFPGEQALALQILIKSLKPGEAVWNLNHAAGLLDPKTLFVGLSFSRDPWKKKVSKCAAVLHDAYGGKVSWKVFSTPDDRTITKAWFDTLLGRIKDTIEQERPARIVFYRTGEMGETELGAVQDSLTNCAWLGAIHCTFVSILDVGNFRFYAYGQAEKRARNLPAGYGIIVNQREAFLSTSTYDERSLRQGTVIPIRLKLEIGDDDILDLLKEYHDLTYLNWPSPRTTGKYPLVATIAEKFAALIRENIPAESLIYLDI